MNEEINIIVCVKQVPDPEGPPSAFEVDSEEKKVVPRGIPPVMSPFDQNALEAALRIKDSRECKVTVLSMGRRLAKAVLRKSLAVGADELILLEDNSFEGLDSYWTANTLASAIDKIGGYDLILTGRQASDWDAAQVGLGIAEILDIPGISLARKVEVEDGSVVVERVLPDGYEVVRARTPALVTVSNEVGDLRYAGIQEIKAVQKKAITTYCASDLGVDLSSTDQIKLLKLYPPIRETVCCFLEGETLEEAGSALALKLREDKVI
ncbi:MAG: electron transfer flavoprotein subunit beta/FixA family protein [Halobacteriota archaeon]|nr:electron transfer flavoprotein subunit beta/FixA family protein [Halobacteriota archaeon]